jgi:hypothetical protein
MGTGRGLPTGRGLSYREIERAASGMRRVLGIPEKAMIPLGTRLFESLEQYQCEVDGNSYSLSYSVSTVVLTEAQAAMDVENGDLVVILSEETYGGLEQDDPRARFSLCHELGHVRFHVPELMKLSRMPHTDTALLRGRVQPHAAYEDTEWQANAFAAALLMPAAALRDLERAGRLNSGIVRREFGVSFTAAETRVDVYQGRKRFLLN